MLPHLSDVSGAHVLKVSRPFYCTVSPCLLSWWLSFLSVSLLQWQSLKVLLWEKTPWLYQSLRATAAYAPAPKKGSALAEAESWFKVWIMSLPSFRVLKELGKEESFEPFSGNCFPGPDFPNLNIKFGNTRYEGIYLCVLLYVISCACNSHLYVVWMQILYQT